MTSNCVVCGKLLKVSLDDPSIYSLCEEGYICENCQGSYFDADVESEILEEDLKQNDEYHKMMRED